MSRISLVWIIILFAVLGTSLALAVMPRNLVNPRNSQVVTTTQDSPSPIYNPSPDVQGIEKEAIAEPKRLTIPKLNVDATVELVGEDAQGNMDVPKGVFNVGWYSLGFKPGESGSAVMAGHLDTATGAPAVFYNINNLKTGDEIIVTDTNGKTLTFEVTNTISYPFNQVPLQEIFGSNEKPMLNLITCIGVWDRGTRNYSNRLVVFTVLKS